MVRDKVAVFDREPQYGNRLADYAKQHSEYGIDVLIFTRAAALRDYLLTASVSLLLVSELLAEQLQEIWSATGEEKEKEEPPEPEWVLKETCGEVPLKPECCFLWEEKAAKESGEQGIFRYQPLGELMERLREQLDRIRSEKTSREAANALTFPKSQKSPEKEVPDPVSGQEKGQEGSVRLPRIICVVSPSGGCGKTMLAKKLACREADMRQTFLLPLELYPDKTKEDRWKSGFSELLYYIRQQDKKLAEHFHNMICKEAPYDTIYAGDTPMDYLYLTPEDLSEIFKLLGQEGYETLVADIGFMNQATLELLEQAAEIILLNRKDESAAYKMECWRETLIHMGKENLLHRMVEAG